MNTPAESKLLLPEQVVEQRLSHLRRKKSRYHLFCNLTATVLLTYLCFGLVFGIAFIQGQSMSPAFQDGDIVFIWRLSKHYSYDDVLLFKSDTENQLIKRVAAVPGDTITVDAENRLLIKGQPLTNAYAKPGMDYPITLKHNEYFVLGDNRQATVDSRNFGVVEENNIHGKVLLVLWHHNGTDE